MPNYNFSSNNSKYLQNSLKRSNETDIILSNSVYHTDGNIYSFGGVQVGAESPSTNGLLQLDFSDPSSWTLANSTNNRWEIGTQSQRVSGSGNFAYIVTSAGTVGYSNTSPSRSYIYTTIPNLGQFNSATLLFNLYVNGESSYDGINIWAAPTSVTPLGTQTSTGLSSLTLTGATRLGSSYSIGASQTVSVAIPASFSNTSFRLIIEWANDNGAGAVGVTSGACINGMKILFTPFSTALKETLTSFSQKYNALTNTWSQIADLPVALKEAQVFSHGSTIYIFGGIKSDGTVSAKNYTYSPSTNTYTEMPEAPSNAYYVASAAYGKLNLSGIPYLVMLGGCNAAVGIHSTTTSIIRYNLNTNTWELGGAIPNNAKLGFSANVGNKIVFGDGVFSPSSSSVRVLVYDGDTNSFANLPTLNLPETKDPTALYRGATGFSDNLFVYVGNSIYKLNLIEATTWTKVNNITKNRNGANLLNDGSKIYCVSGYEALNRAGSVELYVPDTLFVYSSTTVTDDFSNATPWKFANTSPAVNAWTIGSLGGAGSTGNSAYITTNGSTKGYVVTAPRVSWLYKTITVPEFNSATLTYYMNVQPETGFTTDGVVVFYSTDTSIIPAARFSNTSPSSLLLTGAIRIEAVTSAFNGVRGWTLPSSLSNKSFVILFAWCHDSSGGTPNGGATIDNIVLKYINRTN